MALIECFECSKEISDQSLSCPHCGFPISSKLSPAPGKLYYIQHSCKYVGFLKMKKVLLYELLYFVDNSFLDKAGFEAESEEQAMNIMSSWAQKGRFSSSFKKCEYRLGELSYSKKYDEYYQPDCWFKVEEDIYKFHYSHRYIKSLRVKREGAIDAVQFALFA